MKRIASLFSAIFTLISSSIFAQHIYVEGTGFMQNGCPIYMNGANTPWDNWNDFGGSYNSNFWSTHFAEMSSYGLNSSRIWISCSGAGQPYVSSDGTVSPPTQAFWDDMDDMLSHAQANGIYIMATVISFDHFKEPNANYQGWRTMIQSAQKTQTFIDNYLLPLVERYADNPYLFSIDLCNEPEWIHENASEGQIAWTHLQRYAGMCAAAIHNSSSPVLVSIGSAATKWGSPRFSDGNVWSDANLQQQSGAGNLAFMDYWHIHYYKWIDQYFSNPFEETAEYYQLNDRPCVIGETPGRINNGEDLYGVPGMTENDIFENPFTLGYAGVYPWTSNNAGSGDFGSLATFGTAAQLFYNSHTDLVNGTCDNSNNAFLRELTISSGLFSPEFSMNVFNYSITIPAGESIPTVSATAADGNASVTITQVTTLPGTATVTVRSQDGSTTNVYSIAIDSYVPVPTSIEITPNDANVQIGSSEMFYGRVLDQEGNEMSEVIQWTLSGGGYLSDTEGSSTGFESNGVEGIYTLTATSGSLTASATINVTAGIIVPVPDAVDWIVTSLWEDQNNTDQYGASSVGNANSSLNIIHRAWGYGELFAINSGTLVELENGVEYNISFEFQDDLANSIQSMQIGFTNNWTNVVTSNTSTIIEINSGISTTFSEISGTATASTNGNSNLYILLIWGPDPANNKPSSEYNAYIRNLSIVPNIQIADSDNDGTPDNLDGCPNDGNKTEPGYCGCGATEIDCFVTQSISLAQGWNLVSIDVQPIDSTITSVLAGANVEVVKTINEFYIPNQPQFLNTLETIEPSQGYLIFAGESTSLNIEGYQVQSYYSSMLQLGWNLVGVTGGADVGIDALFINTNITVVKDFNAFKKNTGEGELNTLQIGKGYYVKVE